MTDESTDPTLRSTLEGRLWTRVIHDALDDLKEGAKELQKRVSLEKKTIQTNVQPRKNETIQETALRRTQDAISRCNDALNFFFSKNEGSRFTWICDELDYDTEAFREKIREVVKEKGVKERMEIGARILRRAGVDPFERVEEEIVEEQESAA